MEERRKQKAIEESLQSFFPNDKQSLQRKVARLRKALPEASMRADLYNEMIDGCREANQYPHPKKAGTKQ